jgi:hypothetical protein
VKMYIFYGKIHGPGLIPRLLYHESLVLGYQ